MKLHAWGGKRASPFRVGLFVLLSACVVAGYVWRSQFSVDLTDEPFYLAPAWKLFPLGDRPFVDEIYNGPRHSDFLNAVFVASWLPFDVLTLRIAAILLYAAVLLAYVAFWFKGRLGLFAALLFGSLLIFDVFLMTTWSYNWWCRNFILLAALCFFHARSCRVGRLQSALSFASGAALGGAVVAYMPVILGAGIWFGLSLYFFWREERPFLKWSAAGFAFAVLPDWIYSFGPAHFSAWWDAVTSLSSLGYASVSSFSKLQTLLVYVGGALSFTIALPILLVCFRSPTLRGWHRTALALAGLTLLVFAWWRPDFFRTLRFYVGVSSAAALWIAWQWRRDPRVIPVVTALAIAFLMGMASVNNTLALYWVLPAVLIPAMAEAFRCRAWLQRALLFGIVGVIGWGAFEYQRTTSYYDVPPGNCTRRLEVAPLRGLKTSVARAEMIEELARLVEGKQFVLSFADFPGPFYFSTARSAVDTVMVEADAPPAFHLRSLQRMRERARFPELIVHTKVNPWYWGVHHPLSESFFLYPSSDPYVAFTNCVAGTTLVERREYRVVSPDAAKIGPCLDQLAVSEKLASPAPSVIPHPHGG